MKLRRAATLLLDLHDPLECDSDDSEYGHYDYLSDIAEESVEFDEGDEAEQPKADHGDDNIAAKEITTPEKGLAAEGEASSAAAQFTHETLLHRHVSVQQSDKEDPHRDTDAAVAADGCGGGEEGPNMDQEEEEEDVAFNPFALLDSEVNCSASTSDFEEGGDDHQDAQEEEEEEEYGKVNNAAADDVPRRMATASSWSSYAGYGFRGSEAAAAYEEEDEGPVAKGTQQQQCEQQSRRRRRHRRNPRRRRRGAAAAAAVTSGGAALPSFVQAERNEEEQENEYGEVEAAQSAVPCDTISSPPSSPLASPSSCPRSVVAALPLEPRGYAFHTTGCVVDEDPKTADCWLCFGQGRVVENEGAGERRCGVGCHGGGGDGGGGSGSAEEELVAPCRTCAGGLQYIHRSCFQRWLDSSWALACPNCRTLYHSSLLDEFIGSGGGGGEGRPSVRSMLVASCPPSHDLRQPFPPRALTYFCVGGAVELSMGCGGMTSVELLRRIRTMVDEMAAIGGDGGLGLVGWDGGEVALPSFDVTGLTIDFSFCLELDLDPESGSQSRNDNINPQRRGAGYRQDVDLNSYSEEIEEQGWGEEEEEGVLEARGTEIHQRYTVELQRMRMERERAVLDNRRNGSNLNGSDPTGRNSHRNLSEEYDDSDAEYSSDDDELDADASPVSASTSSSLRLPPAAMRECGFSGGSGSLGGAGGSGGDFTSSISLRRNAARVNFPLGQEENRREQWMLASTGAAQATLRRSVLGVLSAPSYFGSTTRHRSLLVSSLDMLPGPPGPQPFQGLGLHHAAGVHAVAAADRAALRAEQQRRRAELQLQQRNSQRGASGRAGHQGGLMAGGQRGGGGAGGRHR